MGSFAKKKWPFLRQIRQKAWVMLEFICIFLKNFFGQTREIFFFLGHVAKFSFPDLGHVATIHGNKTLIFVRENFGALLKSI